jgi:hypothetical protein
VGEHSGDKLEIADESALAKAMLAARDTSPPALRSRGETQQTLVKADDLLPLYCYINEPEHLQLLVESNVGVVLRADFGQG